MLKIRLSRGGARNNPSYRVVVIEKTKKSNGKPVDTIGHWYPKKQNLAIDKDLYDLWVQKGAKPSPAVDKLTKGRVEG